MATTTEKKTRNSPAYRASCSAKSRKAWQDRDARLQTARGNAGERNSVKALRLALNMTQREFAAQVCGYSAGNYPRISQFEHGLRPPLEVLQAMLTAAINAGIFWTFDGGIESPPQEEPPDPEPDYEYPEQITDDDRFDCSPEEQG